MVLAVSEAAGNSVEHAYLEATENDTVELIFWTEPGAVCVEILDHGVWRTPRKEPLNAAAGSSSCVGSWGRFSSTTAPTGPACSSVSRCTTQSSTARGDRSNHPESGALWGGL